MRERTAVASLKVGRSPVFAQRGVVATSQPLAAEAGLQILREGGNAVDAAVAAAATLNVVEPQSTGIGGDMFMLYWSARERRLFGLNGSGRAPKAATPARYREAGFEKMPDAGVFSATVPGAVDGWCAAIERCGSGKMSLKALLAPAIHYAEKGFPVSPIIGNAWRNQEPKLSKCEPSVKTYLPSGRAPRAGEVFRNPKLAASLRAVAEGGREVFYEGAIAKEIVRYSKEVGGLFEMEDFAATRSTWVEPIRTSYRGHELCEIPPNGQGLAALLCLNIVGEDPVGDFSYGSADHLHFMIEAMKLAFADRSRYIADPGMADVPIPGMLSKGYAKERRKLIQPGQAGDPAPGAPHGWSDTIYLTAADAEGNMCSFINSLFSQFGSGVAGGETGIMLQNRGWGFVLEEGHPNCIAPGKRPFHTIIPGFVMKDGEPWMSYGVMGGDMQPQGHVQVLSNMLDFGMDIQEAIDAPRFRVLGGRKVAVENGVPDPVLEELRRRGHEAERAGGYEGFGGGQGIVCLPGGVYIAGSDHRRDGCAVGF
ncbi:MAG: gamma-glutamyltransferase [Candidatus Tectomicrobia bacterium RIFCSPLOWO2_12_FULL_69_37]|nr:MAG: gamma-glutamyltransferase [Candidatus Tectomicrobia bacterium RIFCSPLOWO2_02_FULL_70_19]OGL69243.1 MAG: gamma-glutamyltransferase [Candidatus Tectomicrobia bacterium RIFCSPLOWO2_12_FULL_69_37]